MFIQYLLTRYKTSFLLNKFYNNQRYQSHDFLEQAKFKQLSIGELALWQFSN